MSKFKVKSTVFGLIALILVGVGILSPVQATTNFQDVPSTHIYSEQIRYMKEKGISYGFNNGTEYRPESPITRKEIITLLIKAKYPMEEINNCISANGYTGKNIFNDVPSTHQFAPAICMAKVKNIAVGYTGGNFGPDDATTAHAGIKVIMRTLANDLPIDINAPLSEYTQYLWDRGFYPPTINRANESTVNMNRGEVAHGFHSTLVYLNNSVASGNFNTKLTYDPNMWFFENRFSSRYNYDTLYMLGYPTVDQGQTYYYERDYARIIDPTRYNQDNGVTIKQFTFKYYCNFSNAPIPSSIRNNLPVGHAVIDVPSTVDLSKSKVLVDLMIDESDYIAGEPDFYKLPGKQVTPLFGQFGEVVESLNSNFVTFYSEGYPARSLLCVKEGDHYVVKLVSIGLLDATDSFNKKYGYANTMFEVLRSYR
jgi:hypothetical protein